MISSGGSNGNHWKGNGWYDRNHRLGEWERSSISWSVEPQDGSQRGNSAESGNRERSPQPSRIPTWRATAQILTNGEKTNLVEQYIRGRTGHPDGLTASGLGVYIKVNGVSMQKNSLGEKFLKGTPYEISPDGRMIVRRRGA